MSNRIKIKINANDYGIVRSITNKLRDFLPGYHIKQEKDSYSIFIDNIDPQTVEIAMKKYEKGLGKAGHGGFRFGYEIEEIKMTEREILEKQIRNEYEDKITSLKKKQTELEEKWSKDRKNYEKKIIDLTCFISKVNISLKHNEEKFEKQLQEKEYTVQSLYRQINEINNTPIYKLFFNRFKRYIKRK